MATFVPQISATITRPLRVYIDVEVFRPIQLISPQAREGWTASGDLTWIPGPAFLSAEAFEGWTSSGFLSGATALPARASEGWNAAGFLSIGESDLLIQAYGFERWLSEGDLTTNSTIIALAFEGWTASGELTTVEVPQQIAALGVENWDASGNLIIANLIPVNAFETWDASGDLTRIEIPQEITASADETWGALALLKIGDTNIYALASEEWTAAADLGLIRYVTDAQASEEWTASGSLTLVQAFSAAGSESWDASGALTLADVVQAPALEGWDASGDLTVQEPEPGDFLLDLFPGALSATSMRQLRSGQPIAMIAVKGDLSQQEIAFDENGNLDLLAITTFSGGLPVYVGALFDAVNNQLVANKAINETPLIFDGSQFVTLDTGRVVLQADGVDDYFELFGVYSIDAQDHAHFSVLQALQSDTNNAIAAQIFNFSGLRASSQVRNNDGTLRWVIRNDDDNFQGNYEDDDLLASMLLSYEGTGPSTSRFYRDGNELAPVITGVYPSGVMDSISMLRNYTGTTFYDLKFAENVIYPGGVDIDGIHGNMLAYWGVGPADSGYLLDKFPGSSGAYSLSRLTGRNVNSYTVERESDGATLPIGFAEDDFHDEQALADFCGSSVGRIVVLHDQSQFGNDVELETGDTGLVIWDGEKVPTMSDGTIATFSTGTDALRSTRLPFEGDQDRTTFCLFEISNPTNENLQIYQVGLNDNGQSWNESPKRSSGDHRIATGNSRIEVFPEVTDGVRYLTTTGLEGTTVGQGFIERIPDDITSQDFNNPSTVINTGNGDFIIPQSGAQVSERWISEWIFYRKSFSAEDRQAIQDDILTRWTPEAPGLDPDYQALLDAATAQGDSLPSASIQEVQNQLVLDLKAAGLWDLLDVLFVYSGDSSAEQFSRANWKFSDYQAEKRTGGAITGREGLETSGAILSSAFNLNTLERDDHGIGCMITGFVLASSGSYLQGESTDLFNVRILVNGSNLDYRQTVSGTFSTETVTPGNLPAVLNYSTFLVGGPANSVFFQMYKNGSSGSSFTVGNWDMPNQLLGGDVQGSNELALGSEWAGPNLSPQQQADLSTLLRDYYAAVPIAFDPDYQAVLDVATAQGFDLPSQAVQEIQNQLVLDLKASGSWDRLTNFMVFRNGGADNFDFTRIDWKTLDVLASSGSFEKLSDGIRAQTSGTHLTLAAPTNTLGDPLSACCGFELNGQAEQAPQAIPYMIYEVANSNTQNLFFPQGPIFQIRPWSEQTNFTNSNTDGQVLYGRNGNPTQGFYVDEGVAFAAFANNAGSGTSWSTNEIVRHGGTGVQRIVGYYALGFSPLRQNYEDFWADWNAYKSALENL